METQFITIFENAAVIQLSALLAAALFFLMVGLKETRSEHPYSLLFIAIGVFFLAAHFIYLTNIPESSGIWNRLSGSGFWSWLLTFFMPALLGLYFVFAAYSFYSARIKAGMVKLFFGLTLFCYLFMLGMSWAVDVKGILVLLWTLMWLEVELKTAV